VLWNKISIKTEAAFIETNQGFKKRAEGWICSPSFNLQSENACILILNNFIKEERCPK